MFTYFIHPILCGVSHINNKAKIGAITIGQSPRTDLTNDINYMIEDKYELIEKGVLDDFDIEYVRENLFPNKNDTVLVSRMRNGDQIILSEEKIIPLIQKCIDELEEYGCKIILLLCTGVFPRFNHNNILIYSQKLAHNVTEIINDGDILGIIVPNKEQVEKIEKLWSNKGIKTKIAVASPYLSTDEIEKNCRVLNDVSVILMDCIGYSESMKKIVMQITGKITIIPRSIVFSVISQLL